ncbi:lipoprotein [Desulfobulbus elongatus]|uniref:LptM family lipoprotein n=1 Tax=Desulfobulbus elongatus TaxID=53332 RepID=UPI000487C4E2|nr:hypothetical protein [Desulfobulbus elongatus]
MSRTVRCLLIAATLVALAGCGVKDSVTELVGLGGPDQTAYSGPVYPATATTAVAFQPAQVDRNCRVFAEALVQFPAKSSGQAVEAAVLTEARTRGADRVLIGQTRQGEDDDGPRFLYYGPAHEYLCAEQCGGWKFGYEVWERQGEWVTLGYREWGKAGAVFDTPLIMQVALLRCQ